MTLPGDQASALLDRRRRRMAMTDKQTQDTPAEGNMKKDPDTWVTGEEPMTGAQRSYLKTLSEEAKQPFDDNLTKAEASRRIDELQAATGRHPPGKEPDREGTKAQGGTSSDTSRPTGQR
jgi:oxalate decarboxylase/phosphoglucose isomerase-like protein (cupin superfamily)